MTSHLHHHHLHPKGLGLVWEDWAGLQGRAREDQLDEEDHRHYRYHHHHLLHQKDQEEEYRGGKLEGSESLDAHPRNPPELPRNGAQEWDWFPQQQVEIESDEENGEIPLGFRVSRA
jgi:hypothetical protein